MTARTVTGNTILLTGSAQASQTVTFVKRFATISGVVITQSGSTTATTDASGDFSKSLDCPADGSTSWTLVTPDGSEFDFDLPYGDGSSVAVTTLISAATVDADAVTLLLDGYEPDLGNPGTNGHVLSSTTAGVRSWVAQSGGGAVSSVFTRTGAVVAAANDYTWAQINKTTSDIADITTKSHTSLSSIGTNTHAQIDTHLASTSNPHSVTAAQAGAQPLDTDLTDIAALTPSNDDIIQRKAGAWTNRTVAELTTDLGLGTLSTQSGTFSGGGTLATGGFTLTVPATGTAALLATANMFTAAQTVRIEDAVTNAVTNLAILNHRSSGTPAASFGAGISFLLESSTTEDQDAAAIEAYWASATHASRNGILRLSCYYIGTKKSLEIYGDSSTAYAKLVWGGNADIGLWRNNNDLVYSNGANHSFKVWNGSSYAECLRIGANGIVDYRGTMADSAKTVGTDAPADWVEIKIGGTQYFIPVYAA